MTKKLKVKLGDYLIEISKLTFGGIVLGTVLNINNVDKIYLIISGLITTLVLLGLGFYLLFKK